MNGAVTRGYSRYKSVFVRACIVETTSNDRACCPGFFLLWFLLQIMGASMPSGSQVAAELCLYTALLFMRAQWSSIHALLVA